MRRLLLLFGGALIILGGVWWFVLHAPEEINEPIVEDSGELLVEEYTIGASVEGRAINGVTFSSAQVGAEDDTHIVFVGGIHGGYEWNSVVLAYRMIDYFDLSPDALPENMRVTIIPNLNPDGVFKVTGLTGRFTEADVTASVEETIPGRFNSNGVDLNRNFDCKWQPTSTWRGETVNAGTAPFSEPEAVALRDFVRAEEPDAVVFWHSQASNVYASECEDGVLPETLDIMNRYATAAGYGAVASFDAYPVTGDAEGWLASIGIPAITVELTTHETIEFEQNKAGVEALLNYYRTL
mgnify:CR=1 FL=1